MNRKDLYKNHRFCMAACTVLLLADTFCIFLIARYLAAFVDILSDFSYQRGVLIVEKLCVVFAVQLACAYVKGRLWTPCRQRRTNDLERALYARYLEGPLRPDSEGRLTVLCEKDIPECVGFFTEKLPGLIQAGAGLLLYSLLLARRDSGLWIAGLLTAFGMIQFLPPLITEKYLVQNYIRAGQAEEDINQELISGLSGMLTIKMLNLHDWFLSRYLQRQRDLRKVCERAAGTASVQSALYSGAALVQQLGFLLSGALLAAGGICSVPALIEAYALSSSFYQYIAILGKLKADRGICRAAEDWILQIFRAPDSSSALYENLEMALPAKGIWLVKGANGSGKSTLFSVLNGSRASRARITRGGEPLSREALRRIAGWCPQMYLPISDSFRELLEMIPEETLDAACLQTCLAEFKIDGGLLDRPLNGLSGGQQKKIALALALSKKSGLLLLDEPEASLDQAGIESLRKLLTEEHRPVLLATHTSLYDDCASGAIYVEGGLVHVREN
nr:ATP-binding cassette domain-containing protein [uncultured Acetatifactor sp.]